jgi:hypothetical protein
MKTDEHVWAVLIRGETMNRIVDLFLNAVPAEDNDGNNERRLHLISLLEQRYYDDEFHARSTSEEKTEMNFLLKQFIDRVRSSVAYYIIGYRLDYDRYTEKEIETVARLFPEILPTKH